MTQAIDPRSRSFFLRAGEDRELDNKPATHVPVDASKAGLVAFGPTPLHERRMNMSATEILAPIVLEPTTQRFIDALTAAGGPPLYTLTPTAAREVLAGAQRQPVAKLPASITDTTFPVGPTGSVRIRIVRPEGPNGVLPVVRHIHGGGWILGDKDTHDRMTREIAVGTNAAVVFVDYDRSPEAKYPTAIEQAYAALRYVADHGRELNVDATR